MPNGKTIDDYLPLLNNDLSRTYLQKGGGRFNDDTVDEDIYTAMLDITKPLNLGSQVTGNIKFGGKVRVFDRQRDVTQFRDNGNGPENGFYGPGQLVDDFPDEFELDPFGQILISNFLQDSVSNEEFFGGDEDLGVEMNAESIDRFYQLFGDEYYTRRILIDNLDYESQEIVSAGYIMGEFNFSKLTLLGGVRVERTDGTYKGFETASGSDDELSIGDEVNVNLIQRENKIYYVELLPQFNLKYKLTDWMDIRAAVTKSLARPNFQNLVPWVQFNSNDNIVNRGNPNLRHTTAWNYDLFLSVYNKFGLFTIGAFYKELDNIDVNSTSIAPPAGVEFPSATVIEPTNLTNTSTVMGIELDAQINFLSLPAPFDGVILSANVTFIDSETSVLVFQRQGDSGPPNFDPDFSNTPRFIPVPGQPDITANLSFGYEKGGFSGRVSTIFQDNSLSALSLAEEFDGFDDLLIRWDATASQKIGEQLQVYANFNNFTNAPIKSFQDNGQETGREIFGYTVDLGVRYRF
ncbi:MAG: TonB-dependent receptor [Cyclobacteriaceae bacterium]|nr:TonB-dependent receptor [Cyclobacteriaceae bacterium HetDA_MAG_MS6]